MAKRKAPRPPAGHPTPDPSSTAPDLLGRFVPALAPLAAAWLLVAVVDLALAALVAGTSLNNGQLPLGAGITLAAYELAILAAGACVVGLLLLMLKRVGRADAHTAVRWAVGGTSGLVVWLSALLYISSWALFWSTSVFLDRQVFAFLSAMNPVQVFHWVYPPLAIGVLLAAFGAAVVVARLVPSWVSSSGPETQRQLVVVAGSALLACLVTALVGGLTYGSEAIQVGQPRSEYAVSRDDQAGPLAHLVADFRRSRLAADEPPVATTDTDKVIGRPIISMDEYVARVSHSDFRRRNVLMVQIESLRSDQLRVYGGTRDVMPTVDALARESRVFTNAYIQASHSNYQDLVPLSSHYPLRSAEMYEYPENPTYPRVLIYDVLKALGYRTAIFSSQNERWGGMLNFHRASSLDRFFHAETFSGPTYTPWGDLGFAAWVQETKGAGSVDDKYTVSEAIQWIDSVASEPFFVQMNLQSSHLPYVVPEDFPHRFSPKELDFAIMWGKFPIEKIDVVKGRYADSLFYEDTQIARLFDHLKRRGLWDNTVIVIGGDNGEAFYEHGFAAHASSLFNEVMKVPMIIRAPGLEPGVDPRPAMFLDVPPSVFHLLGLPPHPSFQGISLFDPEPNPDRSLFMIVQTPSAFQSAIVRSGFKLLHSEWDGRYFLWDQVNDPGETKNLVSSRPDLVEDLAARLRFWRAEQLSYYADVPRQSREYPPVIRD
jgi:arylsulfatase A-like enzyme